MVAMACMYSLLWFYAAAGGRLLAPDADPRIVVGISRSFLPGIPMYAIATATSFASPWLAVSLYGALALFYVLESSLFGQDGAVGGRDRVAAAVPGRGTDQPQASPPPPPPP